MITSDHGARKWAPGSYLATLDGTHIGYVTAARRAGSPGRPAPAAATS